MKKLITLCMAVFVLCFGFYPNALSASEAAEAYETGDVARLNLTPDIDNVEKVYLSHAFGFDSGISDYGYETEQKSEIYAILHYIDSLEPVWDGDEIHAYDTHGFIILIIYNGQKYKALDWSIGRLNVSGSDGTGAQFALSEDKITPLIRLGEAISTGEITVGDDVFSQPSDWAWEGVGVMAAMGVFGGDENGNFLPKDNIKKEELIIALLRIYYAGGFNIPRP